jgi:phosphopantothenoylcysteine decarboxylase/phosphopantothenate--cysteine ligase
MLEGKTIVLGVTGSIAAYKAVDIANQLSRAGVKVDVVMTKEATKFVAPLSFRALTGRAAVIDMFDASSEFNITHISLAGAANVVVIAPATANIIAKLAAGIADDVLSCTVLATKAPVVIAPAMDVNMYENPVTQENVSKLKERGFIFVGPRFGKLASGKEGLGRLANTEEIIGVISQVLGRGGSFADRHVVVTAGSTQEFIDPVRIITNRSSGKMGYALAEAARDRGAEVTLITGPTLLTKPVGVEVIDVCTAEEMFKAVKNAVPRADVLIMAAAVADYRPKSTAKEKIKEKGIGLTLELERTPDILKEVEGNFIRVGFAAESENMVENATQKLQQKKLDLIVANDITAKDSGFGADSNRVTIIDKDDKVESLPLLLKREVAEKVLDKVAKLLAERDKER